MMYPVNNNLSFRAIFQVNGTKQEKDGFVRFIKDEVASSDSRHKSIKTYEYKDSTIVLTSRYDCEQVKKTSDLPAYLEKEKSEIFDADKFYDKKKRELLPQIIEFDPISWGYDRVFSRSGKDVTTFFKQNYIGSKKVGDDERLPRLDFKNPLNILEACNLKTGKTLLSYHDDNFKVFRQAIEKEEKLKELNVKGITGAGESSVIFNIDDKKVLKLSCFPCYPKKMEPFDLPIIDNEKGSIQTGNKTVYYCIQPKGQNSNEVRITRNNVIQVMNQIEQKGYELNDIHEAKFKQIVMLDGKPYLCDYDCAKLPSGEGRLFSAYE